jgi:hypothetical protein
MAVEGTWFIAAVTAPMAARIKPASHLKSPPTMTKFTTCFSSPRATKGNSMISGSKKRLIVPLRAKIGVRQNRRASRSKQAIKGLEPALKARRALCFLRRLLERFGASCSARAWRTTPGANSASMARAATESNANKSKYQRPPAVPAWARACPNQTAGGNQDLTPAARSGRANSFSCRATLGSSPERIKTACKPSTNIRKSSENSTRALSRSRKRPPKRITKAVTGVATASGRAGSSRYIIGRTSQYQAEGRARRPYTTKMGATVRRRVSSSPSQTSSSLAPASCQGAKGSGAKREKSSS